MRSEAREVRSECEGTDASPVGASRSRSLPYRIAPWLLGIAAIALLGVMGWATTRREREVVLARYVTRVDGRTPNQIHNVALAARSIQGRWIKPGAVFSFNRAIGSWSSDSGYKRAPVSYDGELVPSWGGGVCQASSTLYNAALLAGLEIVERHRHRWTAGYIPPGRDAAVAYSNIDLRFRNPYPWPVRLEAQLRGELIEFRVVGKEAPPVRYEVRQRLEAVSTPVDLRENWSSARWGDSRRRVRNPGKRGCRVLTYRVKMAGGREVGRELLSDDSYPAMNRLLLETG